MKRYTLVFAFVCLANFLCSQSLKEGLVFYAPFDGNTINLVDWVKPKNTGAALVENKFGEANKAIAFDGMSALLDYGKIVNLGTSNFSISCWVKAEQFIQGVRYGQGAMLMNKGLTGEAENGYRGFGIRAVNFNDSGNNFRFMTGDGLHADNAPIVQFTDKFGLEQEEWYHLVLTRAKNITEIYLNNELIVTGLAEHNYNLNTDQPFTLGGVLSANGKDASDHFQGQLDEVRIYNRRLSKRDVNLLYQQFVGEPIDDTPIKLTLDRKKTIEVSTFPNPAVRLLNIDFANAAPRSVEVVDGRGRNVAFHRLEGKRGIINVAGFPPGTYFLKIKEGDIMVVRKFVKQGTVLP